MLKFHEEHGGMATVALRTVDNPREYRISDISSDFEIIRFLEKPKKGQVFSNLVSMGIYIFEPEIFDYIEKGTRKDFAYDVIPV